MTPLDAFDDRARKDLPIGKILMPIAIDPFLSRHRHANVRPIGRHDAIIRFPVKEIRQLLLPLRNLLPRRHRVRLISNPAPNTKSSYSPSDISASCALAWQGNCVPVHFSFPSAARRMKDIQNRPGGPHWLCAIRLGSQFVSALVFSSAQIPIEQSMVSISNLARSDSNKPVAHRWPF